EEPNHAHLRRLGNGFALLVDCGFFADVTASDNPDQQLLKNISPSNYAAIAAALRSLSAESQDPFVRQLSQRWGEQRDHCDDEPTPAHAPKTKKRSSKQRNHAKSNKTGFRESWREAKELFNEDYSKSYKEFKKKIAGFDLHEEMRNNSDATLISHSQAVEALGSLVGDGANYLNRTVAERYNYRLNPYTNPGQRTFASWMDELTGRAQRAFTDFFDQFTEHEQIVQNVERLTLQEAAELDLKLAEAAETYFRKKGPLDKETQELVEHLKAVGGATLLELRDFKLSSDKIPLSREQLKAMAYKKIEAAEAEKVANLKKSMPQFPEWLLNKNLYYKRHYDGKRHSAQEQQQVKKTPLQENNPYFEHPQADIWGTGTDATLPKQMLEQRNLELEQRQPHWLGAVSELTQPSKAKNEMEHAHATANTAKHHAVQEKQKIPLGDIFRQRARQQNTVQSVVAGTEHQPREIEKKINEAIEQFKALSETLAQQKATAKNQDPSITDDAMSGAEERSIEVVKAVDINSDARSQEAAQESPSEEQTSEEPSSSGAFFFGGAEAMPVRRILADAEVENYTKEYDRWASSPPDAEKSEHSKEEHHRSKRRAGEKADPYNYLKLDYQASNPTAPAIDFSDIKTALADYVADLKNLDHGDATQRAANLHRLRELEYQIANTRFNNPDADIFIGDATDLYAMRMLDTDPKVRLGFAYFQQRAYEAAKKGMTYYDTGLQDFYGYRAPPQYDDPSTGEFTRINALTAKTLAAIEMQESLDPFRYGMAMAEISVYSQM
ncbi:MAG: hypothetical protein ACRC7P_10005, partial [Enterovibrio sp.]